MTILIISQVLNNNVLLVEDGKKQEKIIWGKGIGYKAHSGQNYSVQPRDKVFESTQENNNKFPGVTRFTFDKIPREYFQIAKQLICFAKEKDSLDFDENVLVELANYIEFAVKKINSDSNSFDPLLFDLKLIFEKEYSIGIRAQKIIEKKTGVFISDNDVESISAILIKHEKMPNAGAQLFSEFSEIFVAVTKIIENCFEQRLPKDDVSLMKLKKHLYYLILRSKATCSQTDLPVDCDLLNKIISNHLEAGVCLNKIIKYLECKMDIHFSGSECLYILIYIIQITK